MEIIDAGLMISQAREVERLYALVGDMTTISLNSMHHH